MVVVDLGMDNNNTVEVVHNRLDLNTANKEASMEVNNITRKGRGLKLITPIEIRMETSTIDTPKEAKLIKMHIEKLKDEPKNFSWSLKENKENITNTNKRSIENTKKE